LERIHTTLSSKIAKLETKEKKEEEEEMKEKVKFNPFSHKRYP